ncbi:MAG: spore coat protein [Clostridia bacterium]|nr:spore coat protein [Clostridia bacterium]MBR3873028.1 spore coat protein [Clostridia bacterium]
MNDEKIMENLLLTTKGACDLYLHGAIESATQNVNNAFDEALQQSLCMQDGIYQKMSAQGWYQNEQADQQQIAKVKNQFAQQQN